MPPMIISKKCTEWHEIDAVADFLLAHNVDLHSLSVALMSGNYT